MRTILLLIILLGTNACAGQSALRSTSARTAVILDQYRSGFRNFAASQSVLNDQIEDRIGQLRSMRAQREGEISIRKLAWALADNKAAQREYALLTEMPAEALLAPGSLLGPVAPSTDPAPAKLAFDTATIDGVIKQLVELQKPRTDRQMLGDLYTFGTATYQSAVEAAADAAKTEAENIKTEQGDTEKAEAASASSVSSN